MTLLHRLIATWIHGTPLAADPVWLRNHKSEQAARRQHKSTRAFAEAKRARVNQALRAAR